MTNLKVPISSDDHIQGNANAPITLVKYGDYECPHCGRAYPILKAVQRHFGNRLRFIFRNFPLAEAHHLAEPAAEAAEFAGAYKRYWEMHDLIYENQDSLSIPLLLDLAQTLGLSVTGLELAIEKKLYEPKIRKDFLGGVRSGVNGTPTFFINNERYNGSWEFEELVSAIDSVVVKT